MNATKIEPENITDNQNLKPDQREKDSYSIIIGQIKKKINANEVIITSLTILGFFISMLSLVINLYKVNIIFSMKYIILINDITMIGGDIIIFSIIWYISKKNKKSNKFIKTIRNIEKYIKINELNNPKSEI